MRYCYYIFFILFFLATACNDQKIQSKEVPSVVLNTLKARYPVTADVDWEKHDNIYEADFDINDSIELTVRIDETGKFVMLKQDVPVSELKSIIIQAIQENYNGYKIDDAEIVEKDGTVYYQIELDKKFGKGVELVFSEDGRNETNIGFWD